jgi:hypothetical protein
MVVVNLENFSQLGFMLQTNRAPARLGFGHFIDCFSSDTVLGTKMPGPPRPALFCRIGFPNIQVLLRVFGPTGFGIFEVAGFAVWAEAVFA